MKTFISALAVTLFALCALPAFAQDKSDEESSPEVVTVGDEKTDEEAAPPSLFKKGKNDGGCGCGRPKI